MRRALLAAVAALALSAAQAQFVSPLLPTGVSSGGGGSGISGVTGTCPTFASTAALAGGVATNAQTGTSYTVAASDCSEVLTFSNASAVAVTLPTSGTLAAAFYANLVNLGAGTVTVTAAAGGSINGASTLALTKGQSAGLTTTDGLNFTALLGVGSSGSFVQNNPPLPVAGFWYTPQSLLTQATQTVAFGATTTYYFPFYVAQTQTLEALSLVITTAMGTSEAVYYSIYTTVGNRPGVPVNGSATPMACTSQATLGSCTVEASIGTPALTLSPNVQLTPGWYWLAMQDASPNSVRTRGTCPPSTGGIGIAPWVGATSAINAIGQATAVMAISQAGTTAGTMPLTPSGFADVTANPCFPETAYEVVSAP